VTISSVFAFAGTAFSRVVDFPLFGGLRRAVDCAEAVFRLAGNSVCRANSPPANRWEVALWRKSKLGQFCRNSRRQSRI